MSTKGVYRTMFFPTKLYDALKAAAKDKAKRMGKEGKVINRYGISNYVRELCEEQLEGAKDEDSNIQSGDKPRNG